MLHKRLGVVVEEGRRLTGKLYHMHIFAGLLPLYPEDLSTYHEYLFWAFQFLGRIVLEDFLDLRIFLVKTLFLKLYQVGEFHRRFINLNLVLVDSQLVAKAEYGAEEVCSGNFRWNNLAPWLFEAINKGCHFQTNFIGSFLFFLCQIAHNIFLAFDHSAASCGTAVGGIKV